MRGCVCARGVPPDTGAWGGVGGRWAHWTGRVVQYRPACAGRNNSPRAGHRAVGVRFYAAPAHPPPPFALDSVPLPITHPPQPVMQRPTRPVLSSYRM